MSLVIDTNVLSVADRRAAQAGPRCVSIAMDALLKASRGLVCVDNRRLILEEYERNVAQQWPWGVGQQFVRHLQNNLYNHEFCLQAAIHPDADYVWEEFPHDSRLANFDSSDRKFVAVVLASGQSPPILNASDTDWWPVRDALRDHGVQVRFLCPELMTSRGGA